MATPKIPSPSSSNYAYRVSAAELEKYREESFIAAYNLEILASYFDLARNGKFTIAELRVESEYERLVAMAQKPLDIGRGGFSHVQLMNIPLFFKKPQAAKITDPKKLDELYSKV